MKGPVRSQHRAGPGEHAVRGVISQRPERAPQRPPQRLIQAARHQALHLRLIQAQPHERVRGRRKLLHQPGPLADHRDQLLPGIGIPGSSPQQLSGPRAGRHPQRDQRPVAMRGEPGEQFAEPLIGDAARDPLSQPGPEQPRPLVRGGRPSGCDARPRARPGGAGPAGTDSPSDPTQPQGGNRRTAAARSRNAPRSMPHNDRPAPACRSPDSPPSASAPPTAMSAAASPADPPRSVLRRGPPGLAAIWIHRQKSRASLRVA